MAITATNYGDILARVFRPEDADLSAEAAHALLKLSFSVDDREYMNVLADKARKGELSAEEQDDIDRYELINNLLGILKSKARRCLREAPDGQD